MEHELGLLFVNFNGLRKPMGLSAVFGVVFADVYESAQCDNAACVRLLPGAVCRS